jgi:hypothetical protein
LPIVTLMIMISGSLNDVPDIGIAIVILLIISGLPIVTLMIMISGLPIVTLMIMISGLPIL